MKCLILGSCLLLLACSQTPLPESFSRLEPAQFEQILDHKDLVVMDVRTPEEVANGQIEGAINLDFRSDGFKQAVDQLDRSKAYGVYCAAGIRSGQTLTLMKDMGFERVFELKTGYHGWSDYQASK